MVNNNIAASLALNKSYAKNLSNPTNNSTSDNFKNVLKYESNKDTSRKVNNSKENPYGLNKKNNNNKTEELNRNNNSKIEELNKKDTNSKIEELNENDKEESKSDDVRSILAQLLTVLERLSYSDNKFNLKIEADGNLLEQILIEEITNGSNNISSDMEKLLQVLSDSSNTEKSDLEVLNGIKDLLSNLSAKFDESNEVHRSFKNEFDEIALKINNLLNGDENSLRTEDLSNNSYSQNYSSSSESSEENSSQMSTGNKTASKEDKFLNSLLGENHDSLENKINIFSNRIQNNPEVKAEANNLTINKATFSDDLIQDVKYMSTNNIKELVVKVNPGNLGQVTIELVQEDGVMKANLKANSKETTALLAQNIAEIKKEIGDQNIKIAEVNVELYNDDTTFFKNGEFGNEFANEQRRSEEQSKNKVNRYFSDDEEQDVISNIAELNNNVDLLV